MEGNKNKVHVKTITWFRDASQLIDYTDSLLYTTSFDISNNGTIIRVGNEILELKPNYPNVSYSQLCTIKATDINYFFKPNEIPPKTNLFDELSAGESAWFVMKSVKGVENDKSNRFLLSEGDVIRCGRILLRIKQIKNDCNYNNTNNSYCDLYQSKITEIKEANKNSPRKAPKEYMIVDKEQERMITQEQAQYQTEVNNPIDTNIGHKHIKMKKKVSKIIPICRICFIEEFDSDPLIRPCICAGTMGYIHYSCLKKWIHSRISVKASLNTDCVTYLISKIECELCKTALPDFIKHKGETLDLLAFTQTFDNYISFETIVPDTHGHRYLYFVKFDENNKISIGRGHKANLIIEEISVSRIHTVITKIQKSIYIEDNTSKFGSLVLMQSSSMKIIQGLPLIVQIGRTNLNMTIKEPFHFFACCGITEYNRNEAYDRENMKHIQPQKYRIIKEENEDEDDSEDDKESDNLNGTHGKGEPFLKLEVGNTDDIEAEFETSHRQTQRKITSVNEIAGGSPPQEQNNNPIETVQEEESQNV